MHKHLYGLLLLVCIIMTTPIAEAMSLYEAVRTDNPAAARQLLASPSGASQREARDAAGRTPLLLATELNRVAIARALIEAGADVNAKDARQDSRYTGHRRERRRAVWQVARRCMTATSGTDDDYSRAVSV